MGPNRLGFTAEDELATEVPGPLDDAAKVDVDELVLVEVDAVVNAGSAALNGCGAEVP